jgi:predicted transcriptional regulator
MTDSTTLTVRLTPELKQRLGRLADGVKRTKSYLAGEAIEAYVTRELEILEGIDRGLDDMKAGRVTSHDDAMRRVRSTIARASKS